MDIAPLGAGFGSFDGQLITAAEYSGLVRAISSAGHITVLNPNNPIHHAESVNFVPLNLGLSGSPVEGFYEANYTPNVLKASGNQFASFKGDTIIASEIVGSGTIWRMRWNGQAFDILPIGETLNQAEQAIFVTPAMLGERDCQANRDKQDTVDDD
jgi:hypothetical protein